MGSLETNSDYAHFQGMSTSKVCIQNSLLCFQHLSLFSKVHQDILVASCIFKCWSEQNELQGLIQSLSEFKPHVNKNWVSCIT